MEIKKLPDFVSTDVFCLFVVVFWVFFDGSFPFHEILKKITLWFFILRFLFSGYTLGLQPLSLFPPNEDSFHVQD